MADEPHRNRIRPAATRLELTYNQGAGGPVLRERRAGAASQVVAWRQANQIYRSKKVFCPEDPTSGPCGPEGTLWMQYDK